MSALKRYLQVWSDGEVSKLAHRAIKELEAENEEWSGFFDAAHRDAEYFRKECDAARRAFKIPDDDGMTWLERANVVANEIRQLKATVQRLECCGNCEHLEMNMMSEIGYIGCDRSWLEGDDVDSTIGDFEVEPHDSCYFTALHWRERKTP